jgi:hypothetical protein
MVPVQVLPRTFTVCVEEAVVAGRVEWFKSL